MSPTIIYYQCYCCNNNTLVIDILQPVCIKQFHSILLRLPRHPSLSPSQLHFLLPFPYSFLLFLCSVFCVQFRIKGYDERKIEFTLSHCHVERRISRNCLAFKSLPRLSCEIHTKRSRAGGSRSEDQSQDAQNLHGITYRFQFYCMKSVNSQSYL